jgi:hypothetical protein
MPNHQNTILRTEGRTPGAALGLVPGDSVLIRGIYS